MRHLLPWSRFCPAFAAGLLLSGPLAQAEIEWRGMLVEHDQPRFALTDTTTGDSKWVPVGGAFLSYSVAHYDADRHVLVLQPTSGPALDLTLSSGVVVPPKTSSAPAADEIADLYGMPLADALAQRGDVELRDLLAQHRAAVLRREDLVRRIAIAEKAPVTSDNIVEAKKAAALQALHQEAQNTDVEVARLMAEITELADQHKKNPRAASGK